jgi:hypothetical protein
LHEDIPEEEEIPIEEIDLDELEEAESLDEFMDIPDEE